MDRSAFLIRIGEFEAGIADALAPERDAVHQTSSALRAITEDAAAAWLALVETGDSRQSGGSLGRRLTQFEAVRLPIPIELRVSEGYAYYALFPDTYAAAARRFAGDTGVRRVHVVGIRSIGTSLSAVVAAALRRSGCAVSTSTVRPRGHPFDRTLQADARFANSPPPTRSATAARRERTAGRGIRSAGRWPPVSPPPRSRG
ncbi:MAG TPA: hypothetical protein VFK57_03455 [Vicinamibacterales bacterium]|nr:hypothetical protein [Vicinamibacterales bacterium]